MRGPAAPKDPVEKRPCLYVILDKMISGRKESDGVCREHIFLEGRLPGQVKFTSGEIAEEILSLLETAEGFRKLVHSIGVTIRAEDTAYQDREAKFQLQCYGKTSKYSSGTCMEMTVPCSGAEIVLSLDSYPVRDEDTVVGSFNILLPEQDQNMLLTVKFYLNDGYEVPELEVDPPVDLGSLAYQAMIANSLVSTGNHARMKSVIDRARAGEEVTIAFIGGSITQGAGAKPINTSCYAYQAYLKFCERFSPCGGRNVHYVKAGVGGTSSELGMVRYERDVLQDGAVHPDLVFVEFAVNDEGDETKGISYESLVKKILDSDNHPAVALLFAVFMDDFNLQERLIPIGNHYDLPMVSLKNAVTPQFYHDSVVTKRQYFYDIYHPTNLGHKIMADCIDYMFEQVDKKCMAKQSKADAESTLASACVNTLAGTFANTLAGTSKNAWQGSVYGTQFSKVCLFDRENYIGYASVEKIGFELKDTDLQYAERDLELTPVPLFPANWMNDGKPGSEFKLTLMCKNLLIVMKDSGGPDFGKADVYVDGAFYKMLDPHIVGWNHCNALILIDEDKSSQHEVVIKVHPGDEGKKFTILGFGVTVSVLL